MYPTSPTYLRLVSNSMDDALGNLIKPKADQLQHETNF
ncbi:hypothetical protein LLB_1289 [Legionella longbeachae D-4968]|nr:hypothetical protein LLB_1289 [Legionella longbeachae D-4968]